MLGCHIAALAGVHLQVIEQGRLIRLNHVDDLDGYVSGLVPQAVAMAKGTGTPVEPRTIIRVMEGPKRRPKPGA